MQHYESERNLEAEITANIENLQNFYGLSSVNSLSHLVGIIIDPKKSQQLFQKRNVTVSSIFLKSSQQVQLDPSHIGVFASKYTFQKLVEKFPKPRGETNRMLSAILQKKFAKQVISSHHTRQNLWLLLSGARFNIIQHKGLYEQLLNFPKYPDYFTRAITQDITRTVKKSETSEGELQSLENVLIAFSRRNPYVGYCQGLNFVAYFLLTMQFTEEEAFWLLSSIIQTVIPMDYYTNMIGVVCDQQVFLTILSHVYPEIVEKFNDVGLDPSVLSIQWFVCLFTSSLPLYLVKIVWDRLLVQGSRAFIKTGIIILGHFKEQILKVQEFHEIIMLLEKRTKQLDLTEAEFNSRFQKIYISREGLVIARTLYREYHIKEKLDEKLTTKKFNPEEVHCDMSWPICAVALQKNRRSREEIDVWTFRTQRPPKLDHQYLLREERKPQKLVPIYQKQKDKEKSNKKDKEKQKDGDSKQKQTKRTPVKISTTTPPQQQKLFSIRQVNETQNQSVSMIKFSSLEARHQNCKTFIINNQDSENTRDLLIGRMFHICDRKPQENVPKVIPKDRRSIIIVDSDEESNEELKRSNIFKMIEGEELEDRFRRSQTILFFSKFVSQNMELSSIIVPSAKKQ